MLSKIQSPVKAGSMEGQRGERKMYKGIDLDDEKKRTQIQRYDSMWTAHSSGRQNGEQNYELRGVDNTAQNWLKIRKSDLYVNGPCWIWFEVYIQKSK